MSNNNQGLVRRNGMIAGVCAGLGARFGISAWIFRILFLLALTPGGVPGIVLYFVFWFFMPKA